VDLNQLKLDWVTSEASRLRQRIIRIDIDFKNAFNSMSQTVLWAVMRAYNIPDVDLLEVIYERTTACMDSDDAECAIITFLTGVIQGGASSPRIFIIFINALLEHLTRTGKALGISHGMVGTKQFNNIAFMDDITTLAQDNPGSQILLDAIQEFEDWSNMRLNLGKTLVMDIDGGSGQQDPPTLMYKGRPVKTFQAEDSCRHLAFWATPNGDMAKTKQRVLAKTREVLPNSTSCDPYGYKPTSERTTCPRGRHLTFSSSRKKEVSKNYPRPSTSLRKHSVTTLGGA